MTLTLYNTLTRRKEPFQPIDRNNVRMYVCGPTVYDLAHIGNARPIIVFDVLFRLLRHIYGESHVTYARNITDVDDKINARAVERFPDMPPTAAIRKLTEETTAQFHKDIAALGVLEPTFEPRATDYIHRSGDRTDMVRIIEQLIARGHAYVAEDHVLFSVESMPDYGHLARRSLEEMEAGARVDVAPYKRGPMDFVLWKPSKPGEPSWQSPAGIAVPGRPGWHIECSAMAGAILGDVFDIHGGGIDLVFPHHENEIAQSRCAHGTSVMANYWMHNGFLQVEGEKMSKSLGNFVTIKELLDAPSFGGRRWAGEVLRLAMLKTHYREPINWSVQRLEEAERELLGWIRSFKYDESDHFVMKLHTNQWEVDSEVLSLLANDLNTPGVVARFHVLAAEARGGNAQSAHALAYTLAFLGCFRPALLDAYDRSSVGASTSASLASKYHHAVYEARTVVLNKYAVHLTDPAQRKATLGAVEAEINGLFPEMAADGVAFVLRESGDVSLTGSGNADSKVDRLITARLAARKAKDWKESDRIRDELAAMGIQLKDSKNPATGEIETTWEVKR